MCFMHTCSDNTISILGRYVCDDESRVECGLRFVQSLLGLRLERHNRLALRHSSTIHLDAANLIHHHTCQREFWFEELDRMMCQDAHTCEQPCKQFCKAPELTNKLTNYKPNYPTDCDYGLLLDLMLLKLQFYQNQIYMVLSFPHFLHSLICSLLVTSFLVFILINLLTPTTLITRGHFLFPKP